MSWQVSADIHPVHRIWATWQPSNFDHDQSQIRTRSSAVSQPRYETGTSEHIFPKNNLPIGTNRTGNQSDYPPPRRSSTVSLSPFDDGCHRMQNTAEWGIHSVLTFAMLDRFVKFAIGRREWVMRAERSFVTVQWARPRECTLMTVPWNDPNLFAEHCLLVEQPCQQRGKNESPLPTDEKDEKWGRGHWIQLSTSKNLIPLQQMRQVMSLSTASFLLRHDNCDAMHKNTSVRYQSTASVILWINNEQVKCIAFESMQRWLNMIIRFIVCLRSIRLDCRRLSFNQIYYTQRFILQYTCIHSFRRSYSFCLWKRWTFDQFFSSVRSLLLSLCVILPFSHSTDDVLWHLRLANQCNSFFITHYSPLPPITFHSEAL